MSQLKYWDENLQQWVPAFVGAQGELGPTGPIGPTGPQGLSSLGALKPVNTFTHPGGTFDLDMSYLHDKYISIWLQGNTTFTVSNLQGGQTAYLRLFGSNITLSFPSFTFFPEAPAEFAYPHRYAFLTLRAFGEDEGQVFAIWQTTDS